MKKTIHILVLAAFCLFLSSVASLAQTAALKIGDQVPDITINNIINYKSSTAKLSDFKGKLLILDFWATWCSSCIKKFPEMAALQKEFTDDLQVLLVNTRSTRDTENRIKDFINKRQNADGTPFSLPTVVNDSLLNAFFPYKLIPHYAWIGPDGRVKAITSAGQVTKVNVVQILQGSEQQIAVKKDIDMTRPLFSSEDLPLASLRQYSTFLKGNIDGLPNGTRYRRKDGISYGRVITNIPILIMYDLTSRALYPDLLIRDVLPEVKDIAKLKPEKSLLPKNEWDRENLYSYELQVPLTMADQLHQFILSDLNRYSDYDGKLENRYMKCLVLKSSTDYKGKVNDQGGEVTLKRVHMLLNSSDGPGMPVIDETGLAKTTAMAMPGNLKTKLALDKYLKLYGLYSEEAERQLEVFVLRDKIN